MAPAFAWAELGTILRRKVKAGLLSESEAGTIWGRFLSLPIHYLGDQSLMQTSREIAIRFNLPALYNAAFLAAAEATMRCSGGPVEFWIADRELAKLLEPRVPEYVHVLDYGG